MPLNSENKLNSDVQEIPLQQESLEDLKLPEAPMPARREIQENAERNFELPALNNALEGDRKLLAEEIEKSERILGDLKDVKEGTELHDKIEKEAYFISQERGKNGTVGTPASDFLAATEKNIEEENIRMEMLNQRWKRLEILSSADTVSNDEELKELREPITEKDIGKEITERKEKQKAEEKERQEAERLAEEKAAKEAQEAQKKKIEDALEVLSDPEVMKRKLEEISEAFESLTGKDLMEEREKMVGKNAQDRHAVIIRGKEATEEHKQKIIEKERKRISEEEHSMALAALWQRNNIRPEDREKYLSDIKKSLGLDANDRNSAIDKLINDGYEVEKAKKGWLSSEIKIPKIASRLVLIGKKGDFLQDAIQRSESEILRKAQMKADLKIAGGRKRLSAERLACTKNLIEQAVEKYNLEKQKKTEDEKRAAELKNKTQEIKTASNEEEKVKVKPGKRTPEKKREQLKKSEKKPQKKKTPLKKRK